MTATVPVLMYHAVTAEPSRATWRLSVTPAMFEAQLRFLRDNEFTPMRFSGFAELLRRGSEIPERPVVLTFDDGYADFHREVFPRLSAHSYPATAFITTGWVGDAKERVGQPPDEMLSWCQIQELASAGIEIGSHSHSHPQLDQLAAGALERELRDSRALLEDRLGQPVTTLAYPFGYSSLAVRRAVRAAGYEVAAAVRNTRARPSEDLLAVPRLTIGRSTSQEVFARILTRDATTPDLWQLRVRSTAYAAVRHTRRMLGNARSRS
jgi:peptidoglycan/xylan/chitin deacetylase (PgdA/CDA1 family)